MKKVKPYSEQNGPELAKALKVWIHEYSRWVDKAIPINWGWIDEVEYMASVRTEIADILNEVNNKGFAPSKNEVVGIKSLDSEWLKQIRQDMPIKIEYQFDKSEYPKQQWLWWLDEMDHESINSLIL